MKNVYITVKGQKVKGTLFYPPTIKAKNPAVLFIHGWASKEDSYIPRAQAVSEQGAICLTINLRGHGKSEGKLEEFSRQDHLKDILTAYDFLVSLEHVDPEHIGICGGSYGGYLAAILSSQRNIKWLVLRAPALYKDEKFAIPTAQLIREDIMAFRQSKVETQENLALQSMSKFKGSILLIESENDTLVPHQTLENYINAIRNKKHVAHKIIKNADHVLSKEEWKKECIDILSKWFGEKFSLS